MMNTYDKLWYARQLLYRLYDLKVMNEKQLKSIIFTYMLMKEYGIKESITLEELYNIKDRIGEEALNANYKVKALALKKLDIILTLIALIKSNNKQALNKLLLTNQLIDDGLIVYSNDNYNIIIDMAKSIENINSKKEELENIIIELRQKYYE